MTQQQAFEGFGVSDFGDDLDFWETPRDAMEAIRPVLDYRMALRGPDTWFHVLEPSAGRGALVDFAKTFPRCTVDAIELEGERFAELKQRHPAAVRGDFFALDLESCFVHEMGLLPWPRFVIGNPPYSLATEFVARSLEWVGSTGCVAMLLQHDFATGVERVERIHTHHQSGLYPLKRRPKFGGDGSGKRPFSWFVFDRGFPFRDWHPIG